MERASYGHEEGLYDRNGFFFRQRRGHLNLRRFEALDLERIIREVDVDLLQQSLEEITFSKFTEHEIQFFSDKQVVKLFNLAQLTIEYLLYSQEKLVKSMNDLAKKYTGKKRALHQKRKEMNELKEETASLQQQLKAKRRNLATLEKVVREANEIKAIEAPAKPKQSPFVKFFMTLPDGLFVEFEELRETTVRQLLLMLRNALSSHRSQKAVADAGESLKLFLKGKLLILDHSLDRCGIQDGDTILVAIPDEAPPKTIEVAPQPIPEIKIIDKTDKESIVIQQKVLEAVEKQVNSLEELAGFLAKSKPEAKDTLSDRLAEELAKIHELLEKNRQQPVITEAPPRPAAPLILGDLEPDGDDNAMAIQEINLKLMQSNLRMSSLDNNVQMSMTDLKELLRLQQEELAELRKALMQRPAPTPSQTIIYEAPRQQPAQSTIIIQQPEPQPQPQPTIVIEEKPKPKPQQRKFVLEQLKETIEKAPTPLVVAEEKREEKQVEIAMSFEPKPKVQEPPKPEPKVVETPPPVEKKIEAPPPQVETPPSPVVEAVPLPVVEIIPITFSSKHYVGYVPPNATDITVEVESDLQVVDIIFEVRKAVANKMNLPFKSTCLVMDGRAIKLGVDIDEDMPFSAKDAAVYASAGRLGIKFERVQLLTNDKIDRITPAWEKVTSESKLRDSADAKDKPSSIPADVDAKKTLGSKAVSRRSYEDEELFGDEEKKKGFKTSYANMRTSFDSLLKDLSERRSLSDQELAEKRKVLNATSASESESTKKTRVSLTKAMSNLAVESGSESAGDEFFRSSLRFSRDLSASVNATNLKMDRSGLGSGNVGGTMERDSVGNWRALVASSPDFITLRRHNLNDEDDDEDLLPVMSRSFSRSMPAAATSAAGGGAAMPRRHVRRSYDDDNDTPMLSSLNQPLSRFADTHEHLPIGGRMREDNDNEEPAANHNSREELYEQPINAQQSQTMRKSFQPRRSWQDDDFDTPPSQTTQKSSTTATTTTSSSSDLHPHHHSNASNAAMTQSTSRFIDDEPTPSFISSIGSRDQSAMFTSTFDSQQGGVGGGVGGGAGRTMSMTAESKLPPSDHQHQHHLGSDQKHSNKSSPPQSKEAKGALSLTSSTLNSQQSQPSQNFDLSSTLDSSQLPDFGTGEIRRAADMYERTGVSDVTEMSGLDTTLQTDDGDGDGVEAFGASKGSNDSPFKTLQFRGRGDSRDSTGRPQEESNRRPSLQQTTGGLSQEDAIQEFDNMSTHSLAISEGDRTEDSKQ